MVCGLLAMKARPQEREHRENRQQPQERDEIIAAVIRFLCSLSSFWLAHGEWNFQFQPEGPVFTTLSRSHSLTVQPTKIQEMEELHLKSREMEREVVEDRKALEGRRRRLSLETTRKRKFLHRQPHLFRPFLQAAVGRNDSLFRRLVRQDGHTKENSHWIFLSQGPEGHKKIASSFRPALKAGGRRLSPQTVGPSNDRQ